MNEDTFDYDCAFCQRSCLEYGMHSVKYPVALKGRVVCDDCLDGYCVICEQGCGRSLDELIAGDLWEVIDN